MSGKENSSELKREKKNHSAVDYSRWKFSVRVDTFCVSVQYFLHIISRRLAEDIIKPSFFVFR